MAAAQKQYAHDRTGPLTVVPVSLSYVPVATCMTPDALKAVLASSLAASPPGDDPFAERDAIIRRRFSDGAKDLGHVEFIFDLGNWNPFFTPDPSDGKKYGSMLQILQYPFSRGSVHIRPASTSDSSLADRLTINPQYYDGRYGRLDLEIAANSHRFAEKICFTEPLASIVCKQVFPEPSEVNTDDRLREWTKRNMVTDWHPVGTCAMGGKAGPRAGVVDERLRVYGVRRLRVADASVMPIQISAHLQSTVYAIAEKVVHMILQDLER